MTSPWLDSRAECRDTASADGRMKRTRTLEDLVVPALRLAGLAIALGLLAGCSDDDPSVLGTPTPGTSVSTSRSAAPTTSRPAFDQLVVVTVRDGKVLSGVNRVPVKKGDVVRLVVTSDVSDEVHLHTYDKRVPVKAGGQAVLTFTASITGVITAELERRHLTLVRFQVQ